MKSSSSFASLVVVATVAFASPAPVPAKIEAVAAPLKERNVGGVDICTEINWGGTCGYAVQPLNTCIVLGNDWYDKIASFGPDPCTVCYAYEESDCGEASWEFTNPGDATGGLGTSNPWIDRIAAFQCEQSC